MDNNFLPQNDPSTRDLDRHIDRALETYLPQPRTGLEQRILARTQTVTPRPAWFHPYLAFLAATAVAACALLAILFVMPGNNTAPHPANTAAANPPQPITHTAAPANLAAAASQPTPKVSVIRKPHRARHTPQEANLPHLAVFPAPAPPTPQEKELAELAVRNPKLLEEASKPIPSTRTKPITIKPIQIKPITIAPLSVAELDPQSNALPHHPENAQ